LAASSAAPFNSSNVFGSPIQQRLQQQSFGSVLSGSIPASTAPFNSIIMVKGRSRSSKKTQTQVAQPDSWQLHGLNNGQSSFCFALQDAHVLTTNGMTLPQTVVFFRQRLQSSTCKDTTNRQG
jgi:LysM repeat protein